MSCDECEKYNDGQKGIAGELPM